MTFPLDVSIVIVNYNTCALLEKCLNSVYEQTKGIQFEVIVSDNGSIDGSIEMVKKVFPQVILIENNANLGFGAANNKGLSIAKGKYIFYLNSDTILYNNSVKIFFDFWENEQDKDTIGALGSNLLSPSGKIIHSYGVFPEYNTEIKRLIVGNINIFASELLYILKVKKIPRRNLKEYKRYYTGEVDYVTGADLFLRNDENAYFDETFLLYYEETDLQYRLKTKGLRRLIIDGPRIVHLEGASNKSDNNSLSRYLSFSAVQVLLSRIIFFKKNNKNTLKLFIIYFFSFMYLSHICFVFKTKELREKLRIIYKRNYNNI